MNDTPFVSKEIIKYLEGQFGLEGLLKKDSKRNDSRQLGYIEGARAVISHLKFLESEQLNKEVE